MIRGNRGESKHKICIEIRLKELTVVDTQRQDDKSIRPWYQLAFKRGGAYKFVTHKYQFEER